MSLLTFILLTALFLLFEGFFSGSELALVSADKLVLLQKSSRGDRGARSALSLTRRPEWFFGTTLLGQNLCVVANSILTASFIASRWGSVYAGFGLLLSPLILIFGEAVPKSLFQNAANRLAPQVAPILVIFSYIIYPVVWVLSRLTRWLIGGLQSPESAPNTEPDTERVTRESLEALIQESELSERLTPPFRGVLLNILTLHRKQAKNIMTPIAEVFSLSAQTTVEMAVTLCQQEGFSCVPVYQDDPRHLVGVIDFYHLLRAKDPGVPISSLMEPPLRILPSSAVRDLYLIEWRRRCAVVADASGFAQGIVTMEDLIEEVVGEIEDEYDQAGR